MHTFYIMYLTELIEESFGEKKSGESAWVNERK